MKKLNWLIHCNTCKRWFRHKQEKPPERKCRRCRGSDVTEPVLDEKGKPKPWEDA